MNCRLQAEKRYFLEFFFINAPDKGCLMTKIARIFGIAGASRHKELTNMTIHDNTNEIWLLIPFQR